MNQFVMKIFVIGLAASIIAAADHDVQQVQSPYVEKYDVGRLLPSQGFSSAGHAYDSKPCYTCQYLGSNYQQPIGNTGSSSSYSQGSSYSNNYNPNLSRPVQSSRREFKKKEEFVNGQQTYKSHHERRYQNGNLIKDDRYEHNPDDFNYKNEPRSSAVGSSGKSSLYSGEFSGSLDYNQVPQNSHLSNYNTGSKYDTFWETNANSQKDYKSEMEKLKNDMMTKSFDQYSSFGNSAYGESNSKYTPLRLNTAYQPPSSGGSHRTEYETQTKYVNGKPVYTRKNERKYKNGKLVHDVTDEKGPKDLGTDTSSLSRVTSTVPLRKTSSSLHEQTNNQFQTSVNYPTYNTNPSYNYPTGVVKSENVYKPPILKHSYYESVLNKNGPTSVYSSEPIEEKEAKIKYTPNIPPQSKYSIYESVLSKNRPASVYSSESVDKKETQTNYTPDKNPLINNNRVYNNEDVQYNQYLQPDTYNYAPSDNGPILATKPKTTILTTSYNSHGYSNSYNPQNNNVNDNTPVPYNNNLTPNYPNNIPTDSNRQNLDASNSYYNSQNRNVNYNTPAPNNINLTPNYPNNIPIDSNRQSIDASNSYYSKYDSRQNSRPYSRTPDTTTQAPYTLPNTNTYESGTFNNLQNVNYGPPKVIQQNAKSNSYGTYKHTTNSVNYTHQPKDQYYQVVDYQPQTHRLPIYIPKYNTQNHYNLPENNNNKINIPVYNQQTEKTSETVNKYTTSQRQPNQSPYIHGINNNRKEKNRSDISPYVDASDEIEIDEVDIGRNNKNRYSPNYSPRHHNISYNPGINFLNNKNFNVHYNSTVTNNGVRTMIPSSWIETRKEWQYRNGVLESETEYKSFYENGQLMHQNSTHRTRTELEADGVDVRKLDLSTSQLTSQYGPTTTGLHSQKYEFHQVMKFRNGKPVYELSERKRYQDGNLIHEDKKEKNENDFRSQKYNLNNEHLSTSISNKYLTNNSNNFNVPGYNPYYNNMGPQTISRTNEIEIRKERQYRNGSLYSEMEYNSFYENGRLIHRNNTRRTRAELLADGVDVRKIDLSRSQLTSQYGPVTPGLHTQTKEFHQVIKFRNRKPVYELSTEKRYQDGNLIHEDKQEKNENDFNLKKYNLNNEHLSTSILNNYINTYNLSNFDVPGYNPHYNTMTPHTVSTKHEVRQEEEFVNGQKIYNLHHEREFRDGQLIHENKTEQGPKHFGANVTRDALNTMLNGQTHNYAQISGTEQHKHNSNNAPSTPCRTCSIIRENSGSQSSRTLNQNTGQNSGQNGFDTKHNSHYIGENSHNTGHYNHNIDQNNYNSGHNTHNVGHNSNSIDQNRQYTEHNNNYIGQNNRNTAHNIHTVDFNSLSANSRMPSGHTSSKSYRHDLDVEENYENGQLVKGKEENKKWVDGQLTDSKIKHYHNGPSRVNLTAYVPSLSLSQAQSGSDEIDTDSKATCSSDYCKNGGKCLTSIRGPICTCKFGFKGEKCAESYCPRHYCRYGGSCSISANQHVCGCLEGYSGYRCSTRSVKARISVHR